MAQEQKITYKEFMLKKRQEENAKRLSNLEQNVPKEMKELKQWCAFKTYYDMEKKETKKFVLKTDGHWAKPNDPSTWSNFDEALAYAKANGCAGLSFALNKNGISCIDLDDCMEKGIPNRTSARLLELLENTYCEKSVSGNGVHIFVRADILEGETFRNRNVLATGQELEVYDNNRFISMTGDTISKAKELGECSEELKGKLQGSLGRKTQIKNYTNQETSASDQEIIERIKRSKKGNEFNQLYAGQSIMGNPSQDDMKLLNILAFFTNNNRSQIESIFKSSGLYRPEKEKYLQHSIDKAASTLTKLPTSNWSSRT